ncbi:UNVERIFIED_ORG: prophage antirepressor-like protein [Buttiauxella agrestis ATCC 33320]
MVSKNSEAQKCANTLGLLSDNTRKGIIDMNIVAKSDLNFQGKALVPVSNITGTWLTSSDLAKALQYSNSRAVTMIYNKYDDEFTTAMTQVLEVSTTGNYRKKVRVFSLRGAHLIAMFARTDVAKEFRRWVLDILDREVAQGNVNPAFDFEMHARNAQTSLSHITYIHQEWCSKLRPALRALGSPLAIDLEDRIKAVGAIAFGLDRALSKQNKKRMIH